MHTESDMKNAEKKNDTVQNNFAKRRVLENLRCFKAFVGMFSETIRHRFLFHPFFSALWVPD